MRLLHMIGDGLFRRSVIGDGVAGGSGSRRHLQPRFWP